MASRIITESDVRNGSAGDPIVVDERTAITPSALDLADARGLRVVWVRDGASAPRVPGPRPGRPAEVEEVDAAAGLRAAGGGASGTKVPVLHLADGRYVVEVDRGRVRLFRLTERGPVPLET